MGSERRDVVLRGLARAAVDGRKLLESAINSGQLGKRVNNWSIRFAPGQLPNVNGFWSITMYDPTFNFTDNVINRYSIGDRTEGLKKDADGGLTIYIQSTSPGEGKESNWLPSTQSGAFLLVMRTYIPGTEIVEQKWAPPPVVETAKNAT